MQEKTRQFRKLSGDSSRVPAIGVVVHRVMPTLTTTYPQLDAVVSLVSNHAVSTLDLTVERSEGHWRQSLFKPESREDPRRGRGQRQAALAQGKNPRPAAVGQRAPPGRRSELLTRRLPGWNDARAFGLRALGKAAPARERGADLRETTTAGSIPSSRRTISRLEAT